MAMNNGETKPINSQLKKDLAFGQPLMIITTPDDDIKGNIDCKVGSLGISLRHRRLAITKYGQISIRYKRYSGTSTEYWKMVSGKSKGRLYIQEFTDAWVVCKNQDIINLLISMKFEIVKNHDKATEAAYINLTDIPHLLIEK